ncbi:MAG: SurA N-terminal domain-containing protein [Pseudomonadales bacterium]|nr:SurA N-terminal domain-containing protein [Pseudomonadales bacterium]
MLQNIRDNMQGVIAKIIIGLIVITFALFGIDSIFSGASEQPAVDINGVEITERELQNAIMLEKRKLAARAGESFDPSLIDDEMLRPGVQQRLVNRQLLVQYADQQGMNVDKVTVDELIRSQADFQLDGVFNQKLFARALNNSGLTPQTYVRSVREEMMLTQVASAYINSEFISDQELTRVATLMQQTRSFSYATITQESVKETINVDKSQLEEHYQKNSDRFMTPEKVAIQYIELNKKSIADSIEISEQAIQDEFELEVGEDSRKAQRTAAHILIEVDETNPEQAIEKARSLKLQLAKGASFEEIAKQHSDDKGSAAEGGQLGVTEGDTFPVEFETALAELEVGQVSEPIKTDAGYHLIKLVDSHVPAPLVFADNRARLLQQLKADQVEKQFIQAAEDLADLAFESSDLAEPSEELGLKIQAIPLFDRSSNEGLLSNRSVVAAAFSDEVKLEGNNSAPIDLGGDRLIVLRVSQHQKPRQLSFAESENSVKKDYVATLARAQVATIGEQAFKDLSDGATASELAEKYHLEWNASHDVIRAVKEVPQDILRQAFSMTPATDEKPSISTVNMANGDFTLIVLTKVTDVADNMSEQERKQFRQSLASFSGQTQFEALTRTLRENADIRVF